MKSCKVIRGGEGFFGKQGLNYFAGISAESANADAICMHLLVMPPGASAKPHYHESDKPARAIIARTDPNEQESVVLLGS